MNDDWVILGGAATPPWDEAEDAARTGTVKNSTWRDDGRRQPGSRVRERLADRMAMQPLVNLSPEEVHAHFRCMPGRYWAKMNEEELLWHLETIHDFFRKLAASDGAVSPVSVNWRNSPRRDLTRVAFCSWDRRGLLESIAAAFSALRVAIQRAEVHTRTDSLVLDIFDVRDSEAGVVGDDSRLKGLPFLVEGAFSDPPRFASIWATEFHKVFPRRTRPSLELSFDNRKSPDYTVLRVEAPDRLGLLYDLVHTLTEHDLQIAQALIDTKQGIAKDQFQFTDSEGIKVTDPSRLRELRKDLVRVISS